MKIFGIFGIVKQSHCGFLGIIAIIPFVVAVIIIGGICNLFYILWPYRYTIVSVALFLFVIYAIMGTLINIARGNKLHFFYAIFYCAIGIGIFFLVGIFWTGIDQLGKFFFQTLEAKVVSLDMFYKNIMVAFPVLGFLIGLNYQG